VLTAGALALAIVAAKALRCRRRRTRGSPTARFAGGWRELTDAICDHGGRRLPAGHTRREEAALLAGHPALDGLAIAVDEAVYGPGEPTAADAAAFWRRIRAVRRDIRRPHRLRGALSLRSLTPRRRLSRGTA
jgi:hypothetical protein